MQAEQSEVPFRRTQPRKFKVYEKSGTLRVSVQDVKNVQAAKVALESVVGVAAQISKIDQPSA